MVPHSPWFFQKHGSQLPAWIPCRSLCWCSQACRPDTASQVPPTRCVCNCRHTVVVVVVVVVVVTSREQRIVVSRHTCWMWEVLAGWSTVTQDTSMESWHWKIVELWLRGRTCSKRGSSFVSWSCSYNERCQRYAKMKNKYSFVSLFYVFSLVTYFENESHFLFFFFFLLIFFFYNKFHRREWSRKCFTQILSWFSMDFSKWFKNEWSSNINGASSKRIQRIN